MKFKKINIQLNLKLKNKKRNLLNLKILKFHINN